MNSTLSMTIKAMCNRRNDITVYRCALPCLIGGAHLIYRRELRNSLRKCVNNVNIVHFALFQILRNFYSINICKHLITLFIRDNLVNLDSLLVKPYLSKMFTMFTLSMVKYMFHI